MSKLSFDAFLPSDLSERMRDEATRGRVAFVVMRPDKGPASPPEPIGVGFAPGVPRVDEILLWENGETYKVIRVTWRMIADAEGYLIALPLLFTTPVVGV